MSLSERERRILADIERHLQLRPPGRWWRLLAVLRRARVRSWLTGALLCVLAILATALVGVALVEACSAMTFRLGAYGLPVPVGGPA